MNLSLELFKDIRNSGMVGLFEHRDTCMSGCIRNLKYHNKGV